MKKMICPLVLCAFALTPFFFFSCSKKDSPSMPPADTTVTPKVSITGISPADAPATSTVTISGFNFPSAVDSVLFNGKRAAVVSSNSVQIVVKVPFQAGTNPIKIFFNGAAITGPNFTYDSAWFVSTVAGNIKGFLDGADTTASFNLPADAVADAQGNLYISDEANNAIRKMTPAGVVTTLAGGLGFGAHDGTGIGATFNLPSELAIDGTGNLYVADYRNNMIRKITPGGVVTTLAGSGNFASQDGTGSAASFANPAGLAIDAAGNLFVAEGNRIRKVTPTGVVTTVAGSGAMAIVDGKGTAAGFVGAYSCVMDSKGNLFVLDRNFNLGNYVRKITPDGTVTTFAGNSKNVEANGTGTAAGFNNPGCIGIDNMDILYVTSAGGDNIRKITPDAVATTFAGSTFNGTTDGLAADARFYGAAGITFDLTGNMYVVDAANNRIRKIVRK